MSGSVDKQATCPLFCLLPKFQIRIGLDKAPGRWKVQGSLGPRNGHERGNLGSSNVGKRKIGKKSRKVTTDNDQKCQKLTSRMPQKGTIGVEVGVV